MVQDESPAAMQHREGPPRFDGTLCKYVSATCHSSEVSASRRPPLHFSSSRNATLMGSGDLGTAGFENRMVSLKDLGATTSHPSYSLFALVSVYSVHGAHMTPCKPVFVCARQPKTKT